MNDTFTLYGIFTQKYRKLLAFTAIRFLSFLFLLLTNCDKKIVDNDFDNPPSGTTPLLFTAKTSYSGSSSSVTLTYSYTFDSIGRVIEKIERDSNDKYSTKYSYVYNENSLLLEATLQKIKTSVKYFYKFTYSNNQLNHIKITRTGSNNYVDYNFTYQGNELGTRTIKETKPDSIPGDTRPLYSQYVYHRLSDRRVLEIDENASSIIYSYNSGNKLVKYTAYAGDTLKSVSYTIDYIYDNYGCLVEERFKNPSERLTLYTYKNYDNVKSAPEFYMVYF